MSEEKEIYAAWAADGQAWRAAQDAWARWLDTLVEQHNIATYQQQERDQGGKWLYTLWIQEWRVFYVPLPWHDLAEEIRERYRRLWDKISEGFSARRM